MLTIHKRRLRAGGKPHVCNICGKSFTRLGAFTVAKKIDENSVECSICSKVLLKTSWRRHVFTHSTARPYSCKVCQKSFRYLDILKRHQQTAHPGSQFNEDRIFTCHICKETFSDGITFNSHKRTHEPENIQCTICNRKFMCLKGLRRHHSIHVKEKEASLSTFKEVECAPEIVQEKRKCLCDICNKDFGTTKKLEEHQQKEHLIVRKYECNLCDKHFLKTSELLRHKQKVHQIALNVCKLCGTSFMYTSTLQWHMNKVHGENDEKYLCKICNARFSDLKRHTEKVHNENEQKYICDICGQILKSSTILEHKKNHLGVKSGTCPICKEYAFLKNHMNLAHNRNRIAYICDVCGKRLVTPKALQIHKNSVHLGIKSLQCNICEKKFARLETLRSHKRIHTGEKPYVCKFCGKSFAQASALKLHLRQHTGQKPYSCDLCEEKFISKFARDYHLKTKHNKI